jgi:hypothetical protein
MKGVSVGTSVRLPESQEGACESLKGPIALAVDVLFRFFLKKIYFFIFFISLATCISLFNRVNEYGKIVIIIRTITGFRFRGED